MTKTATSRLELVYLSSARARASDGMPVCALRREPICWGWWSSPCVYHTVPHANPRSGAEASASVYPEWSRNLVVARAWRALACLPNQRRFARKACIGVHRRAPRASIPSSGALVVLDLTAVPISMRKACLPRRPVWRRISLTMLRTTWTSGRSDSSRCAPSATVRKIWFELSAVSLAREAGVRDYRPLL